MRFVANVELTHGSLCWRPRLRGMTTTCLREGHEDKADMLHSINKLKIGLTSALCLCNSMEDGIRELTRPLRTLSAAGGKC